MEYIYASISFDCEVTKIDYNECFTPTEPLELTDLKLVRNPGNAQRELKLTWTRPTNNDGNVIYKATIEADGVTSTLDSSGTKLYSGRSPATSYTVKVWSQVTDSEKSDEQSLSLYTGLLDIIALFIYRFVGYNHSLYIQVCWI